MRLLFLLLSCTLAYGQGISVRRVAAPVPVVSGSSGPTVSGHSTLPTDLIMYWRLEESSGTRADSEPTGTARNLTDNNSVGSEAGKVGTAASFASASTQSLSVSDNADVSMGNINMSITCWVKLASKAASMDILGQWAEGGFESFGYLLRYNSSTDRFEFKIRNPGNNIYTVSADNFGAPSTGTWYWIRVSHSADGDLILIAVNNGSSNAITVANDGIQDGNTAFAMGGRQNGSVQWFNGALDEVAVWKRLLTTDERNDLWNSGNGIPYN